MLFYTLLLSVVLLVLTDPTEARTLIIGGSDADISQYPYQVSLRYFGDHFCGGSIYKSNIIITAAHCVAHMNSKFVSIAAGYTLLPEAKNLVKVKKIISHEKYHLMGYFENDIAIMVLDRHLSFNSTIQPIGLAKQREPAGSPVTVTGWGRTKEDGFNSDHLKKVEVEIISNEKCQELYSRLKYVITETMLCAGDKAGGKDACQGDSGGPLIHGSEQIGVASWGTGCGRKEYPGVYASIPDLYDWILKVVDNNGGS